MSGARPAFGVLALAGLAATLSSCAPSVDRSVDRTITDAERGVRYTLPAGWRRLDDELLSPEKTIFQMEVFSLEEADPAFVEGLPDTILPQITARTRYYYSVVGEPARTETTLAGQPGLMLRYPIQVRASDPESALSYWIARREDRLFVLRATYHPGIESVDGPAVASIIDSWEFLPGPPPAAD